MDLHFAYRDNPFSAEDMDFEAMSVQFKNARD
jgi:hypothetical protein